MPDVPVKLMMNVGRLRPGFRLFQDSERRGGLARLEFIINRQIGIHPKA